MGGLGNQKAISLESSFVFYHVQDHKISTGIQNQQAIHYFESMVLLFFWVGGGGMSMVHN